MNIYAVELDRLKALCPGAELWDEGGAPLVFLPDMKVEASGAVHLVDLLLCPRARDSYETRLFFSAQLPTCWSFRRRLMGRSNRRLLKSIEMRTHPISRPWLTRVVNRFSWDHQV